jgi:hypothetical protein
MTSMKVFVTLGLICAFQLVSVLAGDAAAADPEAKYRGLLQAFADALIQLPTIAASGASVASPGPYLTQILRLNQDSNDLSKLAVGIGNASQCLDLNTRVSQDIAAAKLDGIQNPVKGGAPGSELFYQGLMQQFGLAVDNIRQAALDNQNATNPGESLSFILDIHQDLAAVDALVAAKDNGPTCLFASKELAIDRLYVLSSDARAKC